MKKLMSVLLCITMLMSLGVTAFASDLDALTKKYNSFEAYAEVWIENNKPMEFLDDVSEVAEFNFKILAEESLNTKITAEMKANLSEDYLSGQVYVSYSYTIPVKFGENFKIDAFIKEHRWIDYDFSSAENIKFLSIKQNLFTDKYDYMKIDSATLEESEIREIQQMIDVIKTITTDGLVEWSDISKNAFEKYATIKKDSDGYVTATLSQDNLIDMVFDMTTGFLTTDSMKDILEFAEVEFDEEALDAEIVGMAKATVKSLNIFADSDALTIKFKTDEAGLMTECEEKLHFNFNIAEFAQALGSTLDEIEPITVENGDVDFVICAKATYANVNGGVDVSFPELTEENSKDLYAEIVEITTDYPVYIPEFIRASYVNGEVENGINYVDVNDFINASLYSYDNLIGNAVLDELGNVTITFDHDYIDAVTVTGNLNSDTYTLNGEYELWGNKPFKVADNILYINVDVLTAVLDCKVQSVETVYMSGNIPYEKPLVNFFLTRPNKGYVPETEVDVEEMIEGAASVGIIGGADGPTEIIVTE